MSIVPEFVETDIGHLPEAWEVVPLADVAELTMGQSPPSSSYNIEGHGMPFFQGKAEFGPRYPIPSKWCSTPMRIAQQGAVLISVRAPVGDVNIAPFECCIGRGLGAINAKDRADNSYLYFMLISAKQRLEEYGTGSTFKSINKGVLTHFPIPLPPLPEQRRIAAVLNAIQDAIAAQEDVIAAARELKRSLMQRLFTYGPYREPAETKETEIGEIPAHWEVGPFVDFCVLQRGFDITKKQQMPGSIPVVSSGGIRSFHNEAMVSGPGVVVGRKGSLGTVHYVESDYWPHDTTLWVRDFQGNNPRFTAYFLESLRLERFDTGAANPTLNRNIVHAEIIGYPEAWEQAKIASILTTVEAKIAVEEDRLTALQALFKSMLHQLMTGQIRLLSDEGLCGTNEKSYA